MFRRVKVCLLFFIFSLPLTAQQIESRAEFLKDSVKIGDPVGYAVVAIYPEQLDIIFPDSASFRYPFEFHSKRWFPTTTDGGYSKDSAVFFVRTFEIDSIQYLGVSLYQLNDGDSSVHYTAQDSIALIHTVESIPDSLSVVFLQDDTNYYRINKLLNYPFLIAFTLIGILLLVAGWFLFGQRIKRLITVRRMQRQNRRFVETYDSLMSKIEKGNLNLDSEQVLTYWKSYMERIETLPYRKMTTLEISEEKEDELLVEALREVDKAIYSEGDFDKVQRNLTQLKSYSQQIFEEKLEKIQHGVPD